MIMAALIAVATAGFAQEAKDWQKGQDVTEQLQWTDYECVNNDQGGWQTAGENVDLWTSPCYELWSSSAEVNGAGTEVYQVFYLPAGAYEFHVNAFYRHTGSGGSSVDISNVRGGEMFCITGVSESGEAAQGSHEFKTKLADYSETLTESRLFERTEEWWDDGDGEWTDTQGRVWYYPQCQKGCIARFELGMCDNALTIVQAQDGYVRIGIRKLITNNGSTIDWMNFRALYQGEASDALELTLASEEFGQALSDAQAKLPTYADYGSLRTLYEDALYDISDMYYGSASSEMTVQAYKEGIALIATTEKQYETYLAEARQLTSTLQLARGVAAGPALPGVEAYQQAVKTAADIEADKEMVAVTKPEDYGNALRALQKARADYAMSQEKREDGSWDFTTMVAYPFFVNMESNPTWNEEEARWVFPNDVNRDQVHFNNDNYWFDTDATGWRHYGQNEHAGYYCAQHWAAGWGEVQLCQDINNLPNGFYSIAGLGMPGLRYQHDKMWIEATTATDTVKSAPVSGRTGFYEGGATSDWVLYRTDLIEVSDGHLRVAFADDSDNNLSFTGMQLFYYGETPDFTLLIQPLRAAAEASIAALELAGDRAAASAILEQLPQTVVGMEAYRKAQTIIAEAETYANTANEFLASHDLPNLYTTLSDQYADNQQFNMVIDVALMRAFDAYDQEDATYKMMMELYADFEAYAHYFEVVNDYKDNNPSATLTAKMDEQLTALADEANGYATHTLLEQYERELAGISHKDAVAGMDLASASATNPIDMTALIKNPSFAEGSRYWIGNADMDGSVGAAQAYNFSFDVHQTIYAMPAGTYEVRMKGLYRDGSLDNAIDHEWTGTDGGFVPNFQLYANDSVASVVSIANENALFNERTFTAYKFMAKNPFTEEMEELRAWMEETEQEGETVVKYYREDFDSDGLHVTVEDNENNWVYDLAFFAGFEYIYFPNSTRGAAIRLANDEGAYENVVTVTLSEEGDLTIGARKLDTIESDWCAFDNFRLYYIGAPSGNSIANIMTTGAAKEQVFGMDGTRRKHTQRGVNVVVGADGQARKVVVR